MSRFFPYGDELNQLLTPMMGNDCQDFRSCLIWRTWGYDSTQTHRTSPKFASADR